MSLIRKHRAVLQAWACLALVTTKFLLYYYQSTNDNRAVSDGY